MKKVISSLLVACLISTLFVGCTTTGGTSGTTVNTNQVKIAATVVKDAAYLVAVLDCKENPDHAVIYTAVGTIVKSLVNSNTLDTVTFQTALLNSNIKELQTAEAQVVVQLLVDIYNNHVADSVNLNINQNVWLKEMLTALSDGVLQGSKVGTDLNRANESAKAAKKATNMIVSVTNTNK
jgi:hypothetical protein